MNYLFKCSRFQAFNMYIYVIFYFTSFTISMLNALIKLMFKQTAVKFEWQKASFCRDCKLRQQLRLHYGREFTSMYATFRISYRFPNFNSIPLKWIKCYYYFQYYNLFYEFRQEKIFGKIYVLDFITNKL